MQIKSVCVFCGASDKAERHYMDLAVECGKMIVKYDMHLVYGGGDSGLMGAVSQTVHNMGGKVTGVFPRFMEKFEPLSHSLDNTILVDSMSHRKDMMIEKSDAFLVIPGGFGTLDELFEVITLNILAQHNKPVIIVNYQGFWDTCLKLCSEIIEKNFARESAKSSYMSVDTLEEAFEILSKL